jgi:hypothetical protein
MSMLLPGPMWTTMRTGFVGYGCAPAAEKANSRGDCDEGLHLQRIAPAVRNAAILSGASDSNS